MKRISAALMAVSFVALLPAAGFAQTGSDRGGTGTRTGTEQRSTTDRPAKRDRTTWSNTQGLHETGSIIGAKVEGPDGKNLGQVEHLLIDPKDGKVSHAVVEVGGILGIGGEEVVVPYDALKMSGHEGGRKARITMDQSTLDQAPKYVRASERQPAASPGTAPRTDRPAGSDRPAATDRPAGTDTKR